MMTSILTNYINYWTLVVGHLDNISLNIIQLQTKNNMFFFCFSKPKILNIRVAEEHKIDKKL